MVVKFDANLHSVESGGGGKKIESVKVNEERERKRKKGGVYKEMSFRKASGVEHL
jgi:hypothetical protein